MKKKFDFVGREIKVGDNVVGMYSEKVKIPGPTCSYRTKAATLALASVIRTDSPNRIEVRWNLNSLTSIINPDRVVVTAKGKE